MCVELPIVWLICRSIHSHLTIQYGKFIGRKYVLVNAFKGVRKLNHISDIFLLVLVFLLVPVVNFSAFLLYPTLRHLATVPIQLVNLAKDLAMNVIHVMSLGIEQLHLCSKSIRAGILKLFLGCHDLLLIIINPGSKSADLNIQMNNLFL
jgi:hypothetical protein